MSSQSYGQLIRETRERLGLSQVKFAALVGVSPRTPNRWENDHSTPRPDEWQRLRAAGVPLPDRAEPARSRVLSLEERVARLEQVFASPLNDEELVELRARVERVRRDEGSPGEEHPPAAEAG